jgi:hypothetical protein
MNKQLLILPFALFTVQPAQADLWGNDLPLLAQIVANTFQTLSQLRAQTGLLESEMAGIKDRIYRISTIAEVVQPSQWEKWKDPKEALNRLKLIYGTLPKEYRSEKSDEIETAITSAMNLVARVSPGANTAFLSGKELERRGADASPGVAQKLTASGVGSLVAMDAQNLIIQSHITNLLAQMLADANEKEARGVISKGQGFTNVSQNLSAEEDSKFSSHILNAKVKK